MGYAIQHHATHRFARISVRKLRPLLDLIRGHYADDALDLLKYMPHRGARMIEQVLKSAMANAEDKGIRNVGDADHRRRPRRRGPDVQAADAPRSRHGLPDPPPDGAHQGRAGRFAGNWVPEGVKEAAEAGESKN